jgi:hypothetical protein
MSNQVDLNKLRETILSSQRQNDTLPTDKDRKIMINKNGQIIEGSKTDGDEKHLSEVHQGVFAHTRVRAKEERRIVREKFPNNTRMIEVDDIKGWFYSFKDEFGVLYKMYTYFDGNAYQVKVVSPEVEGKYDSIHDCHLYKDGRICFGDLYAGGLPSLELAFAKSVVWANGFTIFENTGKYPFSTNNL